MRSNRVARSLSLSVIGITLAAVFAACEAKPYDDLKFGKAQGSPAPTPALRAIDPAVIASQPTAHTAASSGHLDGTMTGSAGKSPPAGAPTAPSITTKDQATTPAAGATH